MPSSDPARRREVYREWYARRSASGKCFICKEPTGQNKKTGRPYVRCPFCHVQHKEAELKRILCEN